MYTRGETLMNIGDPEDEGDRPRDNKYPGDSNDSKRIGRVGDGRDTENEQSGVKPDIQ